MSAAIDMTDIQLMELAAHAAGYVVVSRDAAMPALLLAGMTAWEPLTDDGDALRLAVALKIDFEHGHTFVRAIWYDEALSSTHICELPADADDALAQTRRAIVRAAAEIGRAS